MADVVRRAWSADAGKLLVSSFSVPALACFARQAPHVPCGLLVGALPADWEEVARDIGCVSVHADHRKLTARAADAVKAGGLLLAVYTVNTIPEARRMLSFGVDCAHHRPSRHNFAQRFSSIAGTEWSFPAAMGI